MRSDLIAALDQIEQCNPDPDFDIGALSYMEELATGDKELRELILRYAASSSLNLVRYLALLLAKRSRTGELHPATTLLAVELLRCSRDPETLLSCLTALEEHFRSRSLKSALAESTRDISNFLLDCLEYDGRLRLLVNDGAVRFTADLYDSALRVFSESELIRVRAALQAIRQYSDDSLRAEIARLDRVL